MKPIERLRQQYKVVVEKDKSNSEFYIPMLGEYQAMRLFCLDCELLTFNEIELMEYEVNQSF
jgi:hypothetical protein